MAETNNKYYHRYGNSNKERGKNILMIKLVGFV